MLPGEIDKLKARIRDYRDRRIRLTESDTIRVLILPMLRALGWNLDDLDEVRSEYRHGPGDNPVDCALFLQRSPALFVEAKALGIDLDDRKWLQQVLNYANNAGVDWCVLTNGDEYRIYKVHAPVEAEEKLFLSIRVDDEEPVEARARKFALISRERMGRRAIDALWTDWRVDAQVQAILESLPSDDAFIRLIARRSEGLRPAEIRQSLRRGGLRADYPEIGDLALQPAPEEAFAAGGPPAAIPGASGEAPAVAPAVDRDDADSVPSERSGRRKARLARTTDMFEAGQLWTGMRLTIRGHESSEAVVVDGRRVEFAGEAMSYNAWGLRVTGWSAIQIYEHAKLPDGRLLRDLRALDPSPAEACGPQETSG
jgi:hypothetical protein